LRLGRRVDGGVRLYPNCHTHRPALKVIVEKNHLAVIVVNLVREEIVRWIDW
jgi:hypothetical protein